MKAYQQWSVISQPQAQILAKATKPCHRAITSRDVAVYVWANYTVLQGQIEAWANHAVASPITTDQKLGQVMAARSSLPQISTTGELSLKSSTFGPSFLYGNGRFQLERAPYPWFPLGALSPDPRYKLVYKFTTLTQFKNDEEKSFIYRKYLSQMLSCHSDTALVQRNLFMWLWLLTGSCYMQYVKKSNKCQL